MIKRYELHEWQWQLIRDLFPSPKTTGRKRRDPRHMLNAIFWILCSGASWRDLPERYGPWQSAYHWYRIWTNDGTFDRILERLQVRLKARGWWIWTLGLSTPQMSGPPEPQRERKRGL
jgi:transposase